MMQAQVIDGTLTLKDASGKYVTFRKGDCRKGDWITVPDTSGEWPAAVREAVRTGQLAVAAVADLPPQKVKAVPEKKPGKAVEE